MTKEKRAFEVGQRVVVARSLPKDGDHWYGEAPLDARRGKVVQISEEPNTVSVKWDNEYASPNPSQEDPQNLITEEKAEQVLSALEIDYEKWAAPIRDKVKQAAALLQQAGDLANERKSDLIELSDLSNPLLNTMSKLGWDTSSFRC